MKRAAQTGLTAWRTSGWPTMRQAPRPPQHQEPAQHHRPEELAHRAGAARLEHEQRQQHDHRDRHHPGVQPVRDDADAFDGGQDGDRGGDHAVAVEQAGADQSQQGQAPAGRPAAAAQGELHQGQRAALATVVGAQDAGHVFQRRHQDQHPEQDRQHPQDVLDVGAARAREGDLHRVQRTGADVPVDDAQGADQQGGPRIVFLHAHTLCYSARVRQAPSRGPGKTRDTRVPGNAGRLAIFHQAPCARAISRTMASPRPEPPWPASAAR